MTNIDCAAPACADGSQAGFRQTGLNGVHYSI
jgi:hypothetical protein